VSDRSEPVVEVEADGWTTYILAVACLAGLGVTCFEGALFGGGQFAFRDAARFYYPLYHRVQEEWGAGRLPLWEPGQNGGTPLLGSPMAAVLYPGKVLFALAPYAWAVRLYVVAHVILAFWAMLALARCWGVSRTGATLAGLCYAFGGMVFSNYFNVIYLVGAAWAPLGFRAADRWLRLGKRSALSELTLVLVMQVLGGDPQAAYIIVVCTCGYAIGLARLRETRSARPWLWGLGIVVIVGWAWVGGSLTSWIYDSGAQVVQAVLVAVWALGVLIYVASRPRQQRAVLTTMFAGLAGSCMLAIFLAAAQLFPVLDYIARSVRWAGGGPSDLYDSSLLPYRAVEWVWPNVFGSFFAGNRYWMSLLPPTGAQRPWPLSLYIGALPLVLAAGAAGFRNGPPWRAWMTAVAIVSFWASLGEFAGPSGWSGRGSTPTSGDDSLYGLLTMTLPGLRLFRLPYKLLVFTALALAALTGIGWDRLVAGVARRRVIAVAAGLLAFTILTLAAVATQRDRLVAAMAAEPQASHGVFGPLDAPGAVADMFRSLDHGAVALASSLVVVIWAIRRPASAAMVALPLLAADLALANTGLVMTIPQAHFDRVPEVVQAIRAAERIDRSPGPFRVHRLTSWVPIGWSQVASTRRLHELVDWEIDTLHPSFGLLHGMSYVLSDESETARADYTRFFEPRFQTADAAAAAALGVEPGTRVLFHPRRAFDLWGTRYFILPADPDHWTNADRSYAAFVDQTELIYPEPAAMEGPAHRHDREQWLKTKDVQVRRNKTAFSRAWIVHDARLIPTRNLSKPGARDALSARLGFGDDATRDDPVLPGADLRSLAYIETDLPRELARYLPGSSAGLAESVAVHSDRPTRVVLEAWLQKPGLIILADAFDDAWRLTIDGHPAPILRANLLMRAAAVESGSHTLVYTYEPVSIWIGGFVSLAGMAAFFSFTLWTCMRPIAREVL
jgi:hypothetical protein